MAAMIVLSAVILSGIYWWRQSVSHDQLRAFRMERATKRAIQLANLQATQIEELLLGIDLTLRQFRDANQAGHIDAAQGVIGTAMTAFPAGALVHFSTIDAEGYISGSTVTLRNRVYVGDRPYFDFHRNSGGDRLFITHPMRLRTIDSWLVLLTRPILKDTGFAGVAVVSLSPEYIGKSLAKLEMDPNDVVTLVFDDGAYLARSAGHDQVLGLSVPPDRPFLDAAAPTLGSYRATGKADGVPRIYGWRKLAGYPLIAIVGLDVRNFLGPVENEIERERLHAAIGIALLLALVGAVSLLLLRSARQQDTLAKNDALLRSTLDSTELGILVVADAGAVVEVNRRFITMWRIPDDVVASTQDSQVLARASTLMPDPDGFRREIEDLYRTDRDQIDTLVLKDGRVIERVSRIIRYGGQRARMWSFRDITDRRTAELALRSSEEALRRSELNLRQAQSMAKVVSWTADLVEGTFDCENSRNVLPGWPSGRKSAADLMAGVHPDDLPRMQAAWQAAQDGVAPYDIIHRLVIDQMVRWVHVRAEITRDGNGRAILAVGMTQDITDAKRAESEVWEAKAKADAANLAKSKFLAAASHDLRQPVQTLLLLLSALKRQVTGQEKVAQSLEMMETSVDSLSGLLSGILDISRLDAGVVIPTFQSVDLGAMVERLANEYALAAADKGLRVRSVPRPLSAYTDPTLVERAVRNLIENAIRYTPRGGLLIGIRRHAERVSIDVVDSGIGIGIEEQSQIFEEFYQVNNPGRDQSLGLGLGLSIVSRLARLLGADLKLTSRLGRGSHFSLHFPIDKKGGPAMFAKSSAPEDHIGGRILLIEDNAPLRNALGILLEDSGYEILPAGSGEEAIDLAEGATWRFDAIIADHRLGPGITGSETAKEIRNRAGRPIPTLVLTGDTDKERIAEVFASAFDMMHKPVDPDALCNKIAQMLRG